MEMVGMFLAVVLTAALPVLAAMFAVRWLWRRLTGSPKSVHR